MEVRLAKNYGFCFGVKRAIKIAQDHKDSITLGPLIHNAKEIARLKRDFKDEYTAYARKVGRFLPKIHNKYK